MVVSVSLHKRSRSSRPNGAAWYLFPQVLTTSPSDPDNVCYDTQLDSTEPNQRVNKLPSDSSFPKFLLLPWELRRMVWEFALPRSVFTTAILCSKTYVPYPVISLVCREAHLIVKEFGSMVTAGDRYKVIRPYGTAESITNETDVYVRTWFSPKLDMMMLNPIDIDTFGFFGGGPRCDLINRLRSPTTCLVVHNDWFRGSLVLNLLLDYVYRHFLKNRDKILLSIRDVDFVLKDKAWEIGTAPQVLGTVGSGTQVIRVNDTAALGKYLELWEHCCQYETSFSRKNKHCDLGAWLKMAIDKGKREGARGWMRTYKAWVVEDQAYEKRRVSPEAYCVLRFADHILYARGSRPNRHCGHEVVDYTGNLKKDHPLVRELDIKLPELIPVCTIRIIRRCRCEEGRARAGSILGSQN